MSDNQRSPWFYVGCGCLIIVGLLIVAVAGAGFFGVRKAQQFAEEMQDPEARDAKAMRLLGASSLPEGFHAQIGISVPFLMETAILSDGEPVGVDDTEAFSSDDNIFYYLSFRDVGDDKDEFERYLDGESDRTKALDHINLGFRDREDLTRGTFSVNGQDIRYLAQRGHQSRDRRGEQSLMGLMGIDCPDDERLRVGVWMQRMPEGDEATADTSADWTGTPADERALQDFMEHFAVCDV